MDFALTASQHAIVDSVKQLCAGFQAAWLYDRGQPCAAEANAAKYLAGEAGYRACETAVMTHGGMGYAKEYHVERMLRESLIPRIAPVSRELILSFIAEKVLALPRSY
jgi:acyl-CoA dehydrogenase